MANNTDPACDYCSENKADYVFNSPDGQADQCWCQDCLNDHFRYIEEQAELNNENE